MPEGCVEGAQDEPALALEEVFDRVMAGMIASDWRAILKFEGRMQELLENRSDEVKVDVIIPAFMRAHMQRQLETAPTGLPPSTVIGVIHLEGKRIELLGKMQRFRDQGDAICNAAMQFLGTGKIQEARTYLQRARDLGAEHGFISIESRVLPSPLLLLPVVAAQAFAQRFVVPAPFSNLAGQVTRCHLAGLLRPRADRSHVGAQRGGHRSASPLACRCPHRTVEYDPFIKSQLVSRNRGTCVVLTWSRNTPESGVNETLVLHRVAGIPTPRGSDSISVCAAQLAYCTYFTRLLALTNCPNTLLLYVTVLLRSITYTRLS